MTTVKRIRMVVRFQGDWGAGGMVRILVRASEGLALTSLGGIALLGNLLERHSDLLCVSVQAGSVNCTAVLQISKKSRPGVWCHSNTTQPSLAPS